MDINKMLGFLKAKKEQFLNATTRFKGNLDFLEAVAAAAILVGAADGDYSDKEFEMTKKLIKGNKTLGSLYTVREIETILDKLEPLAYTRSGKSQLAAELDDIANNPEMARMVYLTALDVAEAEGGIDAAEQAVLTKIAGRLGVKESDFDF